MTEELQDRKFRLYDEKRNVTSKISDSCRFVGFGLLAVFYAIKSGEGEFAKLIHKNHPDAVFMLGGLAVFSLLFDYLQFAAAAKSVRNALRDMEYNYDPDSIFYILWQSFFVSKQLTVLAGVVVLGYLVLST